MKEIAEKNYNIALAKRAFWLANMLDPFALVGTSRQIFFIDVDTS